MSDTESTTVQQTLADFERIDAMYIKVRKVEDEVADINYDIERRTCKISGREFKTEAARKTHHKKTYPEPEHEWAYICEPPAAKFDEATYDPFVKSEDGQFGIWSHENSVFYPRPFYLLPKCIQKEQRKLGFEPSEAPYDGDINAAGQFIPAEVKPRRSWSGMLVAFFFTGILASSAYTYYYRIAI